MSNPLPRLAAWVIDVVHSLGYLGVAVLTGLENLLPPIPSEVILPLAGFLAGQGRFSLPGVVLAATVGSVAGALVLYGLGRWIGEEALRRFIRGFGRYLLLKEEDLDRAAAWFDRHGATAVLVGRLVPLVRSGISIPAGIERMPLWRFVVYTAVGSALWNGALVGLGWVLGDQWHVVRRYAEVASYAVIAAIAALLLWFIWRRLRQRRPA